MKKNIVLPSDIDNAELSLIHGRQTVTLLPFSGGNIVHIDVYKLTPTTRYCSINSISLLAEIRKLLPNRIV